MKIRFPVGIVVGLGLWSAPSWAQSRNEVVKMDTMPLYRVTVVARSTKAINYRHRSGATKIDFRGTTLMPEAKGDAKVASKQGYLSIDAHFDKLQAPEKFGPEYLTYVLWAITPDGRPSNLGEIILNGDKSKLDITTELQAFGLIVTAEPYFGVTQPSDVVVMENIVRSDTLGKVEDIEAKFELLQRGQYVYNVKPEDLRAKRVVRDPKRPLEIFEARNAVQIAGWSGAAQYASDTYKKAVDLLDQAENYQTRKHPEKKPAAMIAREAVQTAEDARLISIKRQEEERLTRERQAAANRESEAKAATAAEAQRRTQAEADTAAAQKARAEADKTRAEAELARSAAQADAERIRREAEAARIASMAETERLKAAAAAETDQLKAAAAKERAELEAARAAAIAQQQAAASEAEKARLAAGEADRLRQQSEDARMKSEQEKAALKEQLRQQLNLVLETRSTARGLIVNMSDVLFDTAKYTLRPAAREKLAKIGGILLAHPSLKLEVEGHTDSVGGDDYNQKLSEQRASGVRDYLVQQGISMNNVAARGFGKTKPVVSNDTASGRQQNRRVELVVSGEAIGTVTTTTVR